MFANEFGVDCTEGLLADRELANGKLFFWLNKKDIPFFLRIKEGSSVCIKKKNFTTAKKVFNSLSPKEQSECQMQV